MNIKTVKHRHPQHKHVGTHTQVSPLLFHPAAVDDIDDIVNGNRRLGDVGGDDDLGHALWWAVKHRLLFLIGQRGV